MTNILATTANNRPTNDSPNIRSRFLCLLGYVINVLALSSRYYNAAMNEPVDFLLVHARPATVVIKICCVENFDRNGWLLVGQPFGEGVDVKGGVDVKLRYCKTTMKVSGDLWLPNGSYTLDYGIIMDIAIYQFGLVTACRITYYFWSPPSDTSRRLRYVLVTSFTGSL